MPLAEFRVGVLVVAPTRSWHGGDGRVGAATLCRVLVDRFGARVVVVSGRQMASPDHVRHAVAGAMKQLSDCGVITLVVSGQVWHFARRSGDLLMLALPGSPPGRPGSMLPLADLFTIVAIDPEHSTIVCADLMGTVSPELVADVLPGAAMLIGVDENLGSACQDALAVTLGGLKTTQAVGAILAAARLVVTDRPAVVRHGDRAAELSPVESAGMLPSFVMQDMASPDPGSRLDAVVELVTLADRDPVARVHLAALATDDSDRTVREFASRLLHQVDRPSLPQLVRDGLIPADLLDVATIHPEVPDLLDQPGGRVVIGVDAPEGDESCRPRHHVDLAPHRLSRTVVTNRQYLAFVVATGQPCPDNWAADGDVWSEPESPVVMVSWVDANRYCAWLTQHLRALGALSADSRVLLPSEAEWEAAAGNLRGDRHPWGTAIQSWPANTRVAGIGAVTAAGRFPDGANFSGCQDLIGNVWEWTRSKWGHSGRTPSFTYPYDPGPEREADEAPDIGMRFVIRGGAFYYATECANSFTRNRMHAGDRHPAGGFRVAVIHIGRDTT